MRSLLVFLMLILYSCGTINSLSNDIHSSLNDSEKAIKLEPKSYSVLGNLRITIDPKDNFYDKIMMAAKKQYGDNIDIINIKKDMRNLASKSFITSAPIIVNCLVIRYD